MHMPGFWRQGGARFPALLLRPLGWLYGQATLLRLEKPGWRAPVPVISVGNFTAGGAGKTPTAIALARALIARGETPAFITRGYGGEQAGPLLVDPLRHDAVQVGDEARLLARHAPTIVSRDRAAGARLAVNAGVSVIILDDAMQNPALIKDFSLGVIDGGFGFGNGDCVPAGPLRAPVEAMLGAGSGKVDAGFPPDPAAKQKHPSHVDAALVIGADEAGAGKALTAMMPVYTAMLRPDPVSAAQLSGRKMIAYCGIGRPEKFFTTLREIGADICAAFPFPDHHILSAREVQTLLNAAEAAGAQLVTTEKDMARLAGLPDLANLTQMEALVAASIVLPVTLELDAALIEAVYSALLSARSRISTASGPA